MERLPQQFLIFLPFCFTGREGERERERAGGRERQMMMMMMMMMMDRRTSSDGCEEGAMVTMDGEREPS